MRCFKLATFMAVAIKICAGESTESTLIFTAGSAVNANHGGTFSSDVGSTDSRANSAGETTDISLQLPSFTFFGSTSTGSSGTQAASLSQGYNSESQTLPSQAENASHSTEKPTDATSPSQNLGQSEQPSSSTDQTPTPTLNTSPVTPTSHQLIKEFQQSEQEEKLIISEFTDFSLVSPSKTEISNTSANPTDNSGTLSSTPSSDTSPPSPGLEEGTTLSSTPTPTPSSTPSSTESPTPSSTTTPSPSSEPSSTPTPTPSSSPTPISSFAESPPESSNPSSPPTPTTTSSPAQSSMPHSTPSSATLVVFESSVDDLMEHSTDGSEPSTSTPRSSSKRQIVSPPQLSELTHSITLEPQAISKPPTLDPPTSEPPTSEPPTSEPPTSEPPTSEPPVSQSPNSKVSSSQPPTSESPTSESPTLKPPTSESPTLQPPTSESPTLQPPTSESPTLQPPTSESPTSKPPTSEPPTSEPPTLKPPTSESPNLELPTSEPPNLELPTSEPPTSEPPTSKPPTLEPPTSKPPTSEPPVSKPPTSESPTSQPPTSKPPTLFSFTSGASVLTTPITITPSEERLSVTTSFSNPTISGSAIRSTLQTLGQSNTIQTATSVNQLSATSGFSLTDTKSGSVTLLQTSGDISETDSKTAAVTGTSQPSNTFSRPTEVASDVTSVYGVTSEPGNSKSATSTNVASNTFSTLVPASTIQLSDNSESRTATTDIIEASTESTGVTGTATLSTPISGESSSGAGSPTNLVSGLTSDAAPSGTASSNWIPSGLIIEDTSNFPSGSNTQIISIVQTSSPSQTGLPNAIIPETTASPGSNYQVVYIGFKEALIYQFVVANPLSSAQIFQYLPIVLTFPFSDSSSYQDVSVKQLVPSTVVGLYYTTIAEVYFPADSVSALNQFIQNTDSTLYRNKDPTQSSLAALIDCRVPISGITTFDSISGSYGTTNFGSFDSLDFPILTNSRTIAGVTIGATAGCGVFLFSMYLIFKVFKKKSIEIPPSDSDNSVRNATQAG